MDYKNLTDIQLRDNIIGYHDSIYVSECYGTRDLLIYNDLLKEAQERGFQVETRENLVIKKHW